MASWKRPREQRAPAASLDRLRQFGGVSLEIRGNLVRVRLDRDLAVLHRKSKRDRDADTLGRFLTDTCAIVDAAARRAPGRPPPAA